MLDEIFVCICFLVIFIVIYSPWFFGEIVIFFILFIFLPLSSVYLRVCMSQRVRAADLISLSPPGMSVYSYCRFCHDPYAASIQPCHNLLSSKHCSFSHLPSPLHL